MRLTLTFTNGANLAKELLQHCCQLVNLLRRYCRQVVHHCKQESMTVTAPAWGRRHKPAPSIDMLGGVFVAAEHSLAAAYIPTPKKRRVRSQPCLERQYVAPLNMDLLSFRQLSPVRTLCPPRQGSSAQLGSTTGKTQNKPQKCPLWQLSVAAAVLWGLPLTLA